MSLSFFITLFTLLVNLLLYKLCEYNYLTERNAFFLLTILLILYLLLQVVITIRAQSKFWILNPIIQSSIFLFGLSYAFSNFLFFFSSDQLENLGVIPEINFSMVKLMYLILIGATSMWIGYYSLFSKISTNKSSVAKFNTIFMGFTNEYRSLVIPFFIVISTITRYIQLQLGIFGFSSVSYDNLIEAANYSQYLSLGSALSKAALLLVSLKYYSGDKSNNNKFWFYFIVSTEVLWGFLSGFKSQVITPFIILAVSQYIVTNKLKFRWLIYLVIFISLAYIIIEPYRAYRLHNNEFSKNESIFDLIENMREAQKLAINVSTTEVPLILAVSTRSNLTWIGSFGIQFKDDGYVSSTAPNFLKNIISAPFHAFIPRVIWKTKPVNNLGLWYNNEIIGNQNSTSIAMGPITFLYFSGGPLMIFLGFFFVGFIQKIVFSYFNPAYSFASAFIFLVLLSGVSNIESSFNSYITSIFRDVPILIIVIHFVFKKPNILKYNKS